MSTFLRGFLVLVFFTQNPVNALLVRTKQGDLRGLRVRFPKNEGPIKTVHKFLGVPYAQPPIGELRFKQPQVPQPWEGVYDARYFKEICMQDSKWYATSIKRAWPEFSRESISEDCLYLNIYTPSPKPHNRFPVIFYIHGGGFFAGTPVRDVSPGEFLPLRGVVLVTVQYRLGILGFFSTGNSEAPGNVGLLDQVAALKWTQENIIAFGGDPDSVTLLGESAGGSSVSLHYLSPLSKGLFQRAIAVSGVDLSPFAISPKSIVLQYSQKIAQRLECEAKTPSLMLECLRSKPSSTFVDSKLPIALIQPFVDGYFLPAEPKELRETGKFHNLPLMSGFVSQEGSFLLEDSSLTYTVDGFKEYIKDFLTKYIYHSQKLPDGNAFGALEFQYTPWADIEDRGRIRKKIIELLTDYNIVAPTHAVLSLHCSQGAPTYLFEFRHRSKNHEKPEWMGVVHGDTTAYKFGLPLLGNGSVFDEVDQNISDMLVTMYVNFAKYSNPTPTPVYGIQWQVYNATSKAYLKIQKRPIMATKFHPARMAFWNSYFPRLIKPQRPVVRQTRRSSALAWRSSVWSFLIFLVLNALMIH